MSIVPFYAAVLALLFVALSIRTLRMRRRLRIAIGDSGNNLMLRAMRVHSNFSEYVPLSLILIFLLENQGAHAAAIHLLCVALLIGRVAHSIGLSQEKEDFRFRVFGMALTLTTIITASMYLLIQYAIYFVL